MAILSVFFTLFELLQQLLEGRRNLMIAVTWVTQAAGHVVFFMGLSIMNYSSTELVVSWCEMVSSSYIVEEKTEPWLVPMSFHQLVKVKG